MHMCMHSSARTTREQKQWYVHSIKKEKMQLPPRFVAFYNAAHSLRRSSSPHAAVHTLPPPRAVKINTACDHTHHTPEHVRTHVGGHEVAGARGRGVRLERRKLGMRLDLRAATRGANTGSERLGWAVGQVACTA
jgi:hypothetical protein